MKKCENCKKDIYDIYPSGLRRHWVHRHSGHELCNKPDIAIPRKKK